MTRGLFLFFFMRERMATISLVMIVKNEAATLEQAVRSALPVIDEVVIGVDDSCTDETPQIAERLASPGKLFSFTWEDNFAATRNAAIDRADGDLIFILDGHEMIAADDNPVLYQLSRMRDINIDEVKLPTSLATLSNLQVDGMPEAFDVACLTVAMNIDEFGIPQLFFLQPRIFRNRPEIRYQNPVHNALGGYKSERTMALPEVVLLHNMPAQREAERKRQRKKMNLSGLAADIRRERPKPLAQQDGRPFFYMANSYADMGKGKKALYWYRQYLPRSKFGEEKYQALQQAATLALRIEKDHQAAMDYALQAVSLHWQRAEPFVLLGEIAADRKDFQQAIHWLTLAKHYKAPYTVMFTQGAVYTFLPDTQIARIYADQKDWLNAIKHLDMALTWRPHDEGLLNLRQHFREQTRRRPQEPNFLLIDRLRSFTGDLVEYFNQQHFTVAVRPSFEPRWAAWADVAWCEWCDENMVAASHYSWTVPLICRLHSYEAFGDLPTRVDWRNVAHLVFVAEHIRQLFISKWPDIKVAMSVIPNGVRTDHLTFRERQHGKRIGYLGYLNHKKGVDILLQAARLMIDYEFHIAGLFQDPHLAYYFDHAIADLPNIWFYGWVEPSDKDAWLEKVDYLISPSIVESFGYSIAEAMVKGIFPILHDRQGVIYPEHTFRSVTEIRALLERPYESEKYRQFIVDNYSLDKQVRATRQLVEGVLNRPPPVLTEGTVARQEQVQV